MRRRFSPRTRIARETLPQVSPRAGRNPYHLEANMATAKKAPAKKTAAKRSSTAGRKTTRSPADATTLLMKDHKDVKALFRRYEKLAKAQADREERQELAWQICSMLTVHATIEEEIFYPAIRAVGVDEGLLDEAEVEHASAKELIAQIRGMGPDDELYDAKVKVLGEYVNHHVEEEEGEMFPKARRAKADLEGLAAQLKARKEALMAESGDMAMAGDGDTPASWRNPARSADDGRERQPGSGR
jgi:hemerythrin superfamily protein